MRKLKLRPVVDVCGKCSLSKWDCACHGDGMAEPPPPPADPPAGARRTHHCPLYHLVPIELMEAVADTREGGDLKYSPGNWQQGDLAFFVDCVNHTIEHLYGAVDQENPDSIIEHLGHAACNIAFILWALKRGVISRSDFNRAAVIYQEAADAADDDLADRAAAYCKEDQKNASRIQRP